MASHEPLRVAVIGTGGIAQMMHLPTLTERPDLFDVRALCDADERTLKSAGDRWGVTARHRSLEDVLALRDVEAVLLCAGGSHEHAVGASLDAGKHVFVEKPLGFCLSEAERSAQAASRRSLVVQIGTHKRYDPAVLRAKQRVEQMREPSFIGVRVLHPDDGAYRAHHALQPRREPGPAADHASTRAGILEATRGPHAAAIDELVGQDGHDDHRVAALILFQSLIHDTNLVRGLLANHPTIPAEPDEVLFAHAWNGGLCQSSLTRFGELRVEMTWLFLPGLKHYAEEVRILAPATRVALDFPSPYLRHQPTPLVVERSEGGELVREEHVVGYEEAFVVELHAFFRSIREGAPVLTDVNDAVADARWLSMIAGRFGTPS